MTGTDGDTIHNTLYKRLTCVVRESFTKGVMNRVTKRVSSTNYL